MTADLATADRFVAEVDAAAVLVNASTRFVDGGELGLGRGGRDLDAEAARERADGVARADLCQMGRERRGAGAQVSGARESNEGHEADRAVRVDAGRVGTARRRAAPVRVGRAVRSGLADVQYLADEGIAGVVYLADRLAKPVLVEGPAGTGKTQLAKSVADLTGQPPDPAAVLRGARRVQGALRVELPQAAAAHPGGPGDRDRGRPDGRGRGPRGARSRRTSSPRSSCSPGPCSRPSGPTSRWCSWSTRSTGSRSRPRRCCWRSSRSTRCRSPSSGPSGPPGCPWCS